MLNKATLIGRIGRDPESQDVNGTKLTKFSIATSESWKNKQGEKQEETQWHNCNAWGKLAEIIEQYVKKGDLIYVEGKIQTRKYEKDGQDHYATDIKVSEMKMLGSKGANSSGTSPEPNQPEPNDGLPF